MNKRLLFYITGGCSCGDVGGSSEVVGYGNGVFYLTGTATVDVTNDLKRAMTSKARLRKIVHRSTYFLYGSNEQHFFASVMFCYDFTSLYHFVPATLFSVGGFIRCHSNFVYIYAVIH